MMELAEFISATRSQISIRIKGANEHIRGTSGTPEAPVVFLMRPGSSQEHGAGVDFDVAIATKLEGNGQASAKVKVAVFEAEMSGKGGGTKENVSCVRFRVAVNQWHGLVDKARNIGAVSSRQFLGALMGIIDQTGYTLICPICNISESQKVLDKGSNWNGSWWQSGAEFVHFDATWDGGGGAVEPKLLKATCNQCRGAAQVASRY